MSFSSDVDHRGYPASSSRLGRILERRGGLTIRTSWTDQRPTVTLLWDRPLFGWVWHWINRPMVFEVDVKREGQEWVRESYPVDTRPVRR